MQNILIFKGMIDANSVPFVAFTEQGQGYYNDQGDWVTGGTVPVNMSGIILPLTEDDLRYAENGVYSVKDRKIFTTNILQMGQKIEHKGIRYTIQNFKDYNEYVDVNIYYARWSGS